MADKQQHEYTPDEIARAKMGAKLSDAVPTPENPTEKPLESGHPQPTHDEVAEQARRDEQARDVTRDRDDRMIKAGRGQQTTGRL